MHIYYNKIAKCGRGDLPAGRYFYSASKLAEARGFEPLILLRVYLISSQAHSTTLARFLIYNVYGYWTLGNINAIFNYVLNMNLLSTQNMGFGLIAITIAVLLLLLWNILIQIGLSRLRKKNEQIFAGNKAANLEEVILHQAKNLKTLDKDIQELYGISNQINNLALKSLHKTGMIRFNPFKEVGGDQSFAIALLNGKDNGIIISSLYTREGTRIYSKSITNGKSEKYPLTEEEEKAIKIASTTEPKKIN